MEGNYGNMRKPRKRKACTKKVKERMGMEASWGTGQINGCKSLCGQVWKREGEKRMESLGDIVCF